GPEHAGRGGDGQREKAQPLLGEEGGAGEPFAALGRARVGEAAEVALARRHVAFAAICARVHRYPHTRFSVHLSKLPAPSHGQGPMPAYYRPTNENTRSGRMPCLTR